MCAPGMALALSFHFAPSLHYSDIQQFGLRCGVGITPTHLSSTTPSRHLRKGLCLGKLSCTLSVDGLLHRGARLRVVPWAGQWAWKQLHCPRATRAGASHAGVC